MGLPGRPSEPDLAFDPVDMRHGPAGLLLTRFQKGNLSLLGDRHIGQFIPQIDGFNVERWGTDNVLRFPGCCLPLDGFERLQGLAKGF
jgi:hypothetical protein